MIFFLFHVILTVFPKCCPFFPTKFRLQTPNKKTSSKVFSLLAAQILLRQFVWPRQPVTLVHHWRCPEADCVLPARVSVFSPSPWACPVCSFCCCPEPPRAPRLCSPSLLLWVCAASPVGECRVKSTGPLHLHCAVSTVFLEGAVTHVAHGETRKEKDEHETIRGRGI